MQALRWSLLLVVMTMVRHAALPLPGPMFTLEVPELQMTIPGDSSGFLPRTNFNAFQIVIHNPRTNYGSIRSKINTESAGIIMETKTVGDTVVCSFDLNRRAGFRFQAGRNSVEIEALDSHSHVLYASFLLDVGTGATVPHRSYSASAEDIHGIEKYAVIIGVSRYKDPAIPKLQFADRDAQAVRDFLLSPEGGRFRSDKIAYLVNEDANLKNMRTALYTFLTVAQKQDLVVIYFAGHGSADPNDRRNLYLLPYDTEVFNMGGTAFPMWELQDVFGRIIKARRIVTFADACHSAGLSGASNSVDAQGRSAMKQGRDLQLESGPLDSGNNLINQYLSRYAGEDQRAVLTASDVSERSIEGPDWGGGHGVFTYFLLEGLKGKADLNGDSTVTAGELFDYVREQVVLATQHRQNPTALPGLARDLPLSGTAVRAAFDNLHGVGQPRPN